MGSCASRPSLPADSEHTQYALMWVVSVQHVLTMEKLEPHQVLRDRGIVVKWSEKTQKLTIFVSHQWLGRKHPDPNGEQLRVLQGILKNLIAKKVTVGQDVVSEVAGLHSSYGSRTLSETEQVQLQRASLWLDYFCIPQHLDSTAEMEGLAEEQLRYVHSIPYYVDRCEVFLALVPKALHANGSICNYGSWLTRGWCRTEMWCKLLSTRSQIPLVVVSSNDVAKFTAPQWYLYPVHEGDFAVETDRGLCAKVIQIAMAQKLSELRSGSMTAYRLYLARSEEMSGLPAKRRSMEEFLKEFHFSQPLSQYKGLGPAACATLAGDRDLLRQLVQAKASVKTRAPAMPELQNTKDFTPLHLAVFFRSHDLPLLETLLELRADPQSGTKFGVFQPLHLCRTVGAVDLLVQHGVDVNSPGKQMAQMAPICGPAALGPFEVLERLLQLRADPRGAEHGMATPLHLIAFCACSQQDLKAHQLLLGSRADINHVYQPRGMYRMVELVTRACGRGSGSAVLNWLMNMSTTPLGWSVLLDNEDAVVFLLKARAEPDTKNNRGKRPVDMARSRRIREILQDPSTHLDREPSDDIIVEVL